MQKISSKLVSVQKLANDVFHYDFSFGDTPIDFKAGQFFLIHVDDEKEPKVTRAYSLASKPAKDQFSMCIKLIDGGRASDFLRGIKKGDEVSFSGPFGHFFLRDDEKEIVMVATGTGIAPFVGMLPVLFEQGFKKPITLFYGNTSEKEILYEKELREWEEKYDNFSVIFTLSKPSSAWDGEEGRVQKHLGNGVFDPEECKFYICGNGQMVVDVRKFLMEMGAAKEQIHFEQFTPPKSL